jgi:purine-nucleoside phosphorylase
MLRDLTKSDWQELLKIPDDRIPMALILRGTRDLKGQYTHMRTLFSDVLDIGDSNVVVDDVFIGNLDGASVAYASVYGAPMASEVTHIFGVLGTRLALQIGCCGALSETLAPGDIFAPSTAYCGEGASQYYKLDGKDVAASFGPSEIAELRSRESISIRCGRLYTTSALFAESHQDIAQWRTQGFLAVDMETAATFAVAEHFGMERAALLYVYDCPIQGEHILLNDSAKNERRRLGSERVIALALETAKQHARGAKQRIQPTA